MKKQLIEIAGAVKKQKALKAIKAIIPKVGANKMTQELTMQAVPTAETRTRAVRRDKGQVNTTPRDLVLLTWINEQQAISIDHLQVLLARHSEKSEQLSNSDEVTLPAASRTITRWKKMGYIEYSKINNRQWIWLSNRGIKTLELEYGYYEPALFNHIHDVNKIRLHWEAKKGYKWIPERFIRKTQGKGSGKAHILSQHFPDGEILLSDGKRFAIEVELSVKRGVDKKKIADKYKTGLLPMQHGKNKGLFGYHYDGLIYYTNEKTHESVVKTYAGATGIQVRKLSETEITPKKTNK